DDLVTGVQTCALPIWTPDTHLDAPDLRGAERLDDRAHAVVTAVAPLHARADRAEGEVDVVVDQDEVGRSDAEVPERSGDDGTAQIGRASWRVSWSGAG